MFQKSGNKLLAFITCRLHAFSCDGFLLIFVHRFAFRKETRSPILSYESHQVTNDLVVDKLSLLKDIFILWLQMDVKSQCDEPDVRDVTQFHLASIFLAGQKHQYAI